MQKFRLRETGQTVKVRALGKMTFEDVKTGDVYDIGQLEMLPDKHQWTTGFNVGRYGFYLFWRDYFKYKTYGIGVNCDIIRGTDRATDMEIRLVCYGAGVRIIKLSK